MSEPITLESLKDDLINCYRTLDKYMCYIENGKIENVKMGDIERITKEKHIEKFYSSPVAARKDLN